MTKLKETKLAWLIDTIYVLDPKALISYDRDLERLRVSTEASFPELSEHCLKVPSSSHFAESEIRPLEEGEVFKSSHFSGTVGYAADLLAWFISFAAFKCKYKIQKSSLKVEDGSIKIGNETLATMLAEVIPHNIEDLPKVLALNEPKWLFSLGKKITEPSMNLVEVSLGHGMKAIREVILGSHLVEIPSLEGLFSYYAGQASS